MIISANVKYKTIKNFAKHRKITFKILNNQMIIKSQFDDWILDVHDNSMVLRHVSKRHNNKQKFYTHIQKKYDHSNIIEALKTIHYHDNYTLQHKNQAHSYIDRLLYGTNNVQNEGGRI